MFSLSLISPLGVCCHFFVVLFSFPPSPTLVRKIWSVFSVTLTFSCSLHLIMLLLRWVHPANNLRSLVWPQPPNSHLLGALYLPSHKWDKNNTPHALWPGFVEECHSHINFASLGIHNLGSCTGHFSSFWSTSLEPLIPGLWLQTPLWFFRVCLYCAPICEDSTGGLQFSSRALKILFLFWFLFLLLKKVFS